MICLGRRVVVELADGTYITANPRHGLLYGSPWSTKSLLVGPFEPGPPAGKVPPAASNWLGSGHAVREGHVTLPPKALSAWRRVGVVSTCKQAKQYIYYTRQGSRAKGRYRHRFNESPLFRGCGTVTLYEYGGQWLRIENVRGVETGSLLTPGGIVG
jgi:hypothetical protein